MNNSMGELLALFLSGFLMISIGIAIYLLFIKTGPAGVPVGTQWFTMIFTR